LLTPLFTGVIAMKTRIWTRIVTPLIVLSATIALLLIVINIKHAEARSALAPGAIAIALPPTWNEVAVTLFHTGLSPEALAACGASPDQTTAVVQSAWSYLNSNIDAIRIAQQSVANARSEVAALSQLVQSGLASRSRLCN
jgi:hypothetical protein